ncbi:NUDIX hydrolase [Marivirga sp. S37H4]|uniref:NUDIX hydrolase n=1 Tax=Marivirga aurantiaca TaxID=2802615 RepID=A0A934WVM7_9BACT|nr:NUDIX hydrolase [Marivirga aurantiaca]MBK6263879.1 NUDIX hydrolase [Marivirga aurantiaca]
MKKFKQQLSRYHSEFPEELYFKEKMLLHLAEKGEKAFLRESADAHFTASAWLIDKMHKTILLLKHKKLNRWLQPGGHADGMHDLELVAIKEVEEETNLTDLRIVSTGIFDIDIHTIPEYQSVKEHEHYDVRYAFFVANSEATKINNESKEFKWLGTEEIKVLTSNPSILRMVEKTQKLF